MRSGWPTGTKVEGCIGGKDGCRCGCVGNLIEKSSIQIPKAINDLDNKELEEIYGINRETLMKIKEKKLKELQKFRVLKKETLQKIYYIKNGDVEGLENSKKQKRKVKNAEMDDMKEDFDEIDEDFGRVVTQGGAGDDDDYEESGTY